MRKNCLIFRFLQPHYHFTCLIFKNLQHKRLLLPIMKYLFFIMGFLLLYLSCLPCGDSRECNVNAQVKFSATDNHQEHKHTSETCTPFCTCSCCAASAFNGSFSKIQISKIVFQSEKYPLYDIAFNTAAYYSIFQPPKFS